MGFVESVVCPILSILSCLYFLAMLLEFVAFGIDAAKELAWNDNLDFLAYMVKILFWVIPKIKEKVGAEKKDQLGIFGYFEELVLNKVEI